MKRIGEPAFTFRLPAIVDGGLGSIDPSHLHGQWVALSFVPHLGRFEIDLFDRQGQLMEELGASLLVVPLETQALQREECVRIGAVHFTVLGDPLGRLRRLYGGVTTQSWGRAQTFLIDPEGRLRFPLVHSLSERGMGVLTELLQAHQDQEIAALF